MDNSIIKITDLHFSYNGLKVLKGVTHSFEKNTLTAITGPSGKGKSTFLTTLNRLWEDVPGAALQGCVELKIAEKWRDVYASSMDIAALRRMVGMVFQIPNPLPMSIFRNMAFPLKLAGVKEKDQVQAKVQEALERAFLWDEVKDRLHSSALELSGGQQQRLCIARALILEPMVLLFDEPTSSLDYQAAGMIEDLLVSLKESCTVLMVSHYLDQVSRIADSRLELADGKLLLSNISR
ncbi:phosphate ABC transporter ATP-binding protein, PhoT family (TC 3.A.1.7.1) [Desulfatibacillum alkenivorans DSM 16219]|jgi:phosphate transport system ATP-binding protein|uniref:Phosphate ABC transporter ATP-binding protein, PhoT family (TC 3.A.1.7.1) n=1 Tax=Desulfatibacillum alkenivorans DSM 16219 TaxID=1121393 RepID=A0A1M6PE23_9BACT|nr:ATP-binding cassette domain-containing protein [Desulfatibacillum alkenivorans]SHK06199.1 phosphate ABC transporter ATP-binding protein, PhoT family (TC 3.A.1.7.1) [Desulfatibacillum alkenivorans DSM 16219]